MSEKFVRNITDTKLRGNVLKDTEPLYTNIQNDLLSDLEDVFVRNKNEYHAITDDIKEIHIPKDNDTIDVEIIDKNNVRLKGKDHEVKTTNKILLNVSRETKTLKDGKVTTHMIDPLVNKHDVKSINKLLTVDKQTNKSIDTYTLDLDLSDYYTLTEVNNLLDEKANQTEITRLETEIEKKATTTEITRLESLITDLTQRLETLENVETDPEV